MTITEHTLVTPKMRRNYAVHDALKECQLVWQPDGHKLNVLTFNFCNGQCRYSLVTFDIVVVSLIVMPASCSKYVIMPI
jgi:hypothetical protein